MPITTRDKIQKLVDAGLTITQIARKSGLRQPTVWRIAHGVVQEPRESAVIAIDRVYRTRLPRIQSAPNRETTA